MGFWIERDFFIKCEVGWNWPNIESDLIDNAYEMSILKYNGENYVRVPKVKGDTPWSSIPPSSPNCIQIDVQKYEHM